MYLAPKGKAPGIGEERGTVPSNGIAHLVSPHGSHRYLYMKDGEAVSALQVVTRDGEHATIANAYTIPVWRRVGYAAALLTAARRQFKSVHHAREEMMSEDAKRWRERVGSPRRRRA